MVLAFSAPARALITFPNSFLALSKASVLNNPGIVFMNPSTGEVLFSKNGTVPKAPASVMKLFSTTDAIRTLGADKVFETTGYITAKKNKIVIIGSGDPWLTADSADAKRLKQAFLPWLVSKAMADAPGVHAISLEYKDLYAQDIEMLKKYFKGKYKIYPHMHSSTSELEAMSTANVGTITSPKLGEIVQYTLLWSDNLIAARLAQMSARAKGLTTDASGINMSLTEMLKSMQIPTDGLNFVDGAGLSHENRVTAESVARLLRAIHSTPALADIYQGLPTAGETGTLRHRFLKAGSSAAGLVRAKTGWINTSVALAGFVQVGEEQYDFAIIASGLRNRESYRASARQAIDKLLATIAKPYVAPAIPADTATVPTL